MQVDIGVILSLLTEKLLVNPIKLHEAIDYIYSEYKTTKLDLGQLLKLTSQYILELFPELAGVEVNEQFNTVEEINNFLEQQKLIYGNSFILTPITEIMAHDLCNKQQNKKR